MWLRDSVSFTRLKMRTVSELSSQAAAAAAFPRAAADVAADASVF